MVSSKQMSKSQPKAKPQPKKATVIKTEKISANMQRVTLHVDEFKDFPEHCEGSYIKLLFNAQGSTDPSMLAEGERPVMRTYTIAEFSRSECTIDVDFVRHETSDSGCGFAARWAMNAVVGDNIYVGGPGLILDINSDADWFFAVADMTALPALSAKIRNLPKDAKGHAVIKVIERDDIRSIYAPENIQVMWLLESESLIEQVKVLPWLPGKVSVWVACEFDDMRALRGYFRNEKEVEKDNIYISSYWKSGVTEDGHKVIKREDAEAN